MLTEKKFEIVLDREYFARCGSLFVAGEFSAQQYVSPLTFVQPMSVMARSFCNLPQGGFMRSKIILIVSLICLLLGIAGCGSNSGSSGPSKATSRLSLPVAIPPVVGLQLTLNFPYGVTVATDASGAPTADVVQLVGGPASTLTHVNYILATTSAGGQLKFIVTDVNGFVSGESVAIQMDITSGFAPAKDDFSITDLSITDLNGVTVDGLTVDFTFDKY